MAIKVKVRIKVLIPINKNPLRVQLMTAIGKSEVRILRLIDQTDGWNIEHSQKCTTTKFQHTALKNGLEVVLPADLRAKFTLVVNKKKGGYIHV